MKLFIFDMGGVVCQNVGVEAKIANIFGMTENEFYECCKYDISCKYKNNNLQEDIHTADIFTLLLEGKIKTEHFWKELEYRTGKLAPIDYFHIFFNPILDTSMVEIIKELRKKYRVVCGTNTIDSHYRTHIERGDYSIFDKVYASNIIRVAKPNIEFWKCILIGEQVKESETFFIDDNENNCVSSSSLGITTHKFINAEKLKLEVIKYL